MEDEFEESEEYAAYLDEVAQKVAEFEDMYGFEHNCHCRADWEENKVGLVSECYVGLCDDALKRCFEAKGELAEAERTMAELRIQIVELGGVPRA